jgi:hypothetical protein
MSIPNPDGTFTQYKTVDGERKLYLGEGPLTNTRNVHYYMPSWASVHAVRTSVEYFLNDVLHRDGDLPAVEHANGDKEWWVNGERHRDGDLPAIERANDREWWVNGERHRDAGAPAFERANGDKEYWVKGKRHRDGGADDGAPAVDGVNGHKEWWENGVMKNTVSAPNLEICVHPPEKKRACVIC